MTRRSWVALAATLAMGLVGGQAQARPAVVKVSLWDRGAMSMAMLERGPMMGMEAGHMPNGPMGISVSTATVPAGDVTFNVTNDSTVMEHEMVVSPVKDERTPLPYNKAAQKVDEDAAGHLGEVAELAQGQKGSLTLSMKPGRYVLYCNIAGHYALGMWTLLTVK
ncbi:MAG: hypothetical protein KF871_03105 [Hydrogenophaga sp.]|uniref:plastocyanin/azurin family copper-binding protein n=1 Tax=Hydrogenophaga sp. TaxID=1904254 RepID=UPI001D5B865E|nr:plastocyanin/azurin family copper-binding protein [Hydrogenophaga sp.]MBX3608859.1 hypothetical protein [Hydrogenophaga sp.]